MGIQSLFFLSGHLPPLFKGLVILWVMNDYLLDEGTSLHFLSWSFPLVAKLYRLENDVLPLTFPHTASLWVISPYILTLTVSHCSSSFWKHYRFWYFDFRINFVYWVSSTTKYLQFTLSKFLNLDSVMVSTSIPTLMSI